MEKLNTFIKNYDCIAVCGCYRYGTTALADTLAYSLGASGYPVMFLNEFLASHQYMGLTEDGSWQPKSMPDEAIRFENHAHAVKLSFQRPFMLRQKLAWLQKTMRDSMIVIKLNPPDWNHDQDGLLESAIIDNPRVFKIGINRADVGNAIISNLIAMHTQRWHFRKKTVHLAEELPSHRIDLSPEDVREIDKWVQQMIFHNNWLWLMRNKLSRLIWHNEIANVDIPELGALRYSNNPITMNPVTHEERLFRYFNEPEKIIAFINQIQHNLNGLVDSVAQKYAQPSA